MNFFLFCAHLALKVFIWYSFDFKQENEGNILVIKFLNENYRFLTHICRCWNESRFSTYFVWTLFNYFKTEAVWKSSAFYVLLLFYIEQFALFHNARAVQQLEILRTVEVIKSKPNTSLHHLLHVEKISIEMAIGCTNSIRRLHQKSKWHGGEFIHTK